MYNIKLKIKIKEFILINEVRLLLKMCNYIYNFTISKFTEISKQFDFKYNNYYI